MRGYTGVMDKDEQTLFINDLYSAVERMTAEIEPSFAGQVDGRN